MEEVKRGRTQRVTRPDLDAGRIRIPVTTETKSLLPTRASRVRVVLRGVDLGPCAYNPRFDKGREHSGVFSIPKDVLRELVAEDEVLPLVRNRQRVIYIGDRGSKLRIAQWVEAKTDELNWHLAAAAPTLADFVEDRPLDWRSPRLKADYRELSDDLWKELALPSPDPPTDGFWPRRQPQWDAVAAAEGPHATRGVVLVEAKSHLAELRSTCTARSPASRETIRSTLEATRQYLGVSGHADWMSGHYQAANRLAFLYYLRARRSIPTWLFFVYFVGDDFEVEGVPQRCPKSEDEWVPAIEAMHDALGLPDCHPLSHFVADVFLTA